MLRLPNPVNITDTVSPVNLPGPADDFQGQNVVIAGWGITAGGCKPQRSNVSHKSLIIYLFWLFSNIFRIAICQHQNRNRCRMRSSLELSGRQHPELWLAEVLLRRTWNQRNMLCDYLLKSFCKSITSNYNIFQGDSGSPVVRGLGRSAVQVAVNSFIRPGSAPPGCSPPSNNLETTTKRWLRPLNIIQDLLMWIRRTIFGETNQHETRTFVLPKALARSAGTDKCRIDTPSVGPRLSAYVPWIRSFLWAYSKSYHHFYNNATF